jgi:hypothetical protein
VSRVKVMVDAADQLPARLDGVEILAGLRRSGGAEQAAAAMPAATYLLTIRFFPSWSPLAPGQPP